MAAARPAAHVRWLPAPHTLLSPRPLPPLHDRQTSSTCSFTSSVLWERRSGASEAHPQVARPSSCRRARCVLTPCWPLSSRCTSSAAAAALLASTRFLVSERWAGKALPTAPPVGPASAHHPSSRWCGWGGHGAGLARWIGGTMNRVCGAANRGSRGGALAALAARLRPRQAPCGSVARLWSGRGGMVLCCCGWKRERARVA